MFSLPPPVIDFMQTIRDRGYEVYVVGGAVRDILRGKEVTNWDFTTSATPEQIMALFPDHFYHNVYGTVTVKIPNSKFQIPNKTSNVKIEKEKNESENSIPENYQLSTINYQLFEITPFRRESGYEDGRHPGQIEWAQSLDEDLGRRDFTINAMATDGQMLVDLYSGQVDLRDKLIRAVGDPDVRFSEDALRMLRAVRFAAELGFLIEPVTAVSIQRNAARMIQISKERISAEFLKILASDYPADGILLLRSTGLLRYVLPELEVCFDVPQKSPKRHHIYDVGTHLIMSLRHCRHPDPITRFATLIHDVGKPKTFHQDPDTQLITFYNHEVVGEHMAEAIADRFALPREQKHQLVTLVAHHQFVVSEHLTDSAIRRFIRHVGRDHLEEMFALRHADRLGGAAMETSWRTELFKKRVAQLLIEPFTVKDLKVDGHDVMDILKLKPSRAIGDILDSLFAQVENKEIPNERDALLKNITTTAKTLQIV